MFKFISLLLMIIPLSLSAQFTIYTPENSDITDKSVNDIVVDFENRVWMASYSNVIMVENDKWNFYDSKNSNLPEQVAERLYLDNNGDIWILFKNAIAKYVDGEFTIIDDKIGGFTFAIDYNQNIWLSKDEELLVKRNGVWEKALKGGIEPKLPIIEILVDKNNDIWIDRPELGFRKIENDTSRLILNPDIPVEDQAYITIKLDSNDNIWASSIGDIAEYNPRKDVWKSYKSIIQELDFNDIYNYSVTFDKNNHCFIGTVIQPKDVSLVYLLSLVNENLKSYYVKDREQQTNRPMHINSLAADFDGNIWFGALYEGVGKFDPSLLSVQQLPTTDYTIYPNPATSQISVGLADGLLISRYKVIDTEGRVVLSNIGDFTSTQTIEVQQLPSGIYMIELTTTTGDLVRDKFVKR